MRWSIELRGDVSTPTDAEALQKKVEAAIEDFAAACIEVNLGLQAAKCTGPLGTTSLDAVTGRPRARA